MKFRDQKTGEVFEDIHRAYSQFCQRRDCGTECPLDAYKECYIWTVDHPAEAARLMGYEVLDDVVPARTNPVSIERLKTLSKLPVYLHIYGQWKGWAILRHVDVKRKRFRFEGAPNLDFDDYMRTWEAFEKKEEPMEKTDRPFVCNRLGVKVGEWFQTLMFDEAAIMDEVYFCVEPDGTFKTNPPKTRGAAAAFLKTLEHPESVIRKPRFTPEEAAQADAARLLYPDAVTADRWMDGYVTLRNRDGLPLATLARDLFPSLQPGQSAKLIVFEEGSHGG